MESMTALLLMLVGWIQLSDTTDCTLHVSSQSSMVSLHCPNSMCQLELQHPQGTDCYSDTQNCYIDNCNHMYNICDSSQNQSSSACREIVSNGGQGVHNNNPPINCTIYLIPVLMEIHLRCPKGECTHAARSNNTTCSTELGIDCEEPPTTTEINTTESLPITSALTSGIVFTYLEYVPTKISKKGLNQGTTSTAEGQATIIVNSTKPVHKPAIVHDTVPIHATKTIYSSTIVHTSKYSSPFSFKEEAATSQTNIVLPVTGAMMGLLMLLLIVVTTGWMWTCWTVRKKNNLETTPQNISATALNLNDNIQTPLQRNIAYEGTSALTASTKEPEESQAETSPVEPTYEIIPLVSTQTDDQNDYNRLNREITQQ